MIMESYLKTLLFYDRIKKEQSMTEKKAPKGYLPPINPTCSLRTIRLADSRKRSGKPAMNDLPPKKDGKTHTIYTGAGHYKLCEAEVYLSQGQTIAQACRKLELITVVD